MQRIINKILRLILPEHKIWELKNKNNIPSMEWSLLNIKKLGFNPRFTIDVGAFDGEWTVMYKKIFPSSKMLMVEAQESKKENLNTIADGLSATSLHIGLLGSEKNKQVTFHVNETVSSVFAEYKANSFDTQLRNIELLDDIVLSAPNAQLPDFIKLDVQGYELEVLKGATGILENVQFILCEVSLIEINKGSPLISDVIQYMKGIGFVSYDICSFIRRPLDKALWQTDILFVRETSPFIQTKHWD